MDLFALVFRGEFAQEETGRPAVHGDVVHDDQEQVFVSGSLNQVRPHQLALVQIHGLPGCVRKLFFAAQLDIDCAGWAGDLHGHPVAALEAGPQRLVPLDDFIQTAREHSDIQVTFQTIE